jgi:hypothetical protein
MPCPILPPHQAVLLRTLFALAVSAPGIAAADADQGVAYFEQHIRPILVENCYKCHSAAKGKHKGGLELDTREAALKGGDSGPLLVPGDPGKSLLMKAVGYGDKDMEMPPDGRLPDAAIKRLEEWVRMGAPDPRAGAAVAKSGALVSPTLEKGREFWSFRPLADPTPPAVKRSGWVRNPVDAFVLARLEAAGLQPAGEIDRRGFIRRASIDAIGLPPTPEEVDAFVADASPAAYDTLIDRLLASPRYGERWGRMWLDLARYADSNGQDENLAHGLAWRYRDYVISAFNHDKPYDRFLTEQIAGDLLPLSPDNEAFRDQLTATGFLTLGPKVLAEQDKPKLVMDVIDEQLDVLGKATMGLTLGCARCHDHKFDPIPTRDYYALAGIFKSTTTFDNLGHVSRWYERNLVTPDEQKAMDAWNSESKRHTEALNKLKAEAAHIAASEWRGDIAGYVLAGGMHASAAQIIRAEAFSRSNLHVDSKDYGAADTPITHSNQPGLQFAEYDLDLPAGHYYLDARYASGEKRAMRLLLNGKEVKKEVCGEPTGGFNAKDQKWSVIAEFTLPAGKNVLRLERDDAVPHLNQLSLLPAAPDNGGLQGAGVTAWARSLARDRDPVFGLWRAFAALKTDEFASKAEEVANRLRGQLTGDKELLAKALLGDKAPASLKELAERYQAFILKLDEALPKERRKLARERPKDKPRPELADQEKVWRQIFDEGGPFYVDAEYAEQLIAGAKKVEALAHHAALDDLEQRKPPASDRIMAVKDGDISDVPVHIRGSHLNLAATKEPRGFLKVTDTLVKPPFIPEKSSGRLELAQWLTSRDHPLTARVMVNRIWLGHFGQGIVRSPSNFGLRGEPPTHPELLDWLARRFQQEGWSVKAMHRLIMRSAAYRMSSAWREDYALKDPENRLLWRMNRRRLDAEAVRDGLLAVSGRLDQTMGGSLLMSKNGDYVTNDQSSNHAQYDAPRRAIYLPVIRNAMYDMFASFDYADPAVPLEQRVASTVAPQSLWLLNSGFAMDQALAFADRIAKAGPDEVAAITAAYRLVYGRTPTAVELKRAQGFLAKARTLAPTTMRSEQIAKAATPERRAWQALCQALLASNEFLYVD